MKKFTEGFTLIELLIVIALLGALAVALLAALDPLEQIKKGTDTGTRNTVAEIHAAVVRYASLQGGKMPFDGTLDFSVIGNAGSGYDALNKVIAQGELKSDFVTLAGNQLNSIMITGINNGGSGDQFINVCYAPTSKSFRQDENTKFNANNGTVLDDGSTNSGNCPGKDGTDTSNGKVCYWCVR